ncbi:MAG: fatty acid desaturase family protein [Planctomycetaceae bacterium]
MSVTVFSEDELEALEQKTSLPRFLFVPTGFIGIWMIVNQWPSPWVGEIIGIALFSYTLLCWTSCFHETAHQTLCSSKSLSIWLGRFLGAAMMAPYSVYRESHIRHHAYLNKPYDWELWPYSDPKTSLTFRRIYVWFDLIFGMFTAPYMYGRIYFHKDSPITDPKIRKTIGWEYVFGAIFWGVILGFVAYHQAWTLFLKIWVIPHLITGLLQNGRKLTEHLGMQSYDPLLGTRTVMGDNWLTRFCTYLNFDIFVHGPHHRHPRVAHNLLVKKMTDYLSQHPDKSYPIYPSYWRATASMLPWIVRNPGVGMNAGAFSPDQEKDPHVVNFVADVTVDVLSDRDAVITN